MVPRVGAGSEENVFPGNSRAMLPKNGNAHRVQRKLQLVSQCHITMAAWGCGQPQLGAFFESVSLFGMIWPVSFLRVPILKGGSSLGS